ncbi:hypothetical protein T265_10382 [Opisthorchis viverrini]|uniref:Uncharacterized protein n=1 Tax=Opisthorchis viverrini TaxID=6198 RepID=A0A074Z6S8_OPIVI|nr:hypothetical protein T265_10382 [Opisthorchis viverrini]KER21257.1 hypothetical protein T265_10382 [Opisthorchis viverrini]
MKAESTRSLVGMKVACSHSTARLPNLTVMGYEFENVYGQDVGPFLSIFWDALLVSECDFGAFKRLHTSPRAYRGVSPNGGSPETRKQFTGIIINRE